MDNRIFFFFLGKNFKCPVNENKHFEVLQGHNRIRIINTTNSELSYSTDQQHTQDFIFKRGGEGHVLLERKIVQNPMQKYGKTYSKIVYILLTVFFLCMHLVFVSVNRTKNVTVDEIFQEGSRNLNLQLKMYFQQFSKLCYNNIT